MRPHTKTYIPRRGPLPTAAAPARRRRRPPRARTLPPPQHHTSPPPAPRTRIAAASTLLPLPPRRRPPGRRAPAGTGAGARPAGAGPRPSCRCRCRRSHRHRRRRSRPRPPPAAAAPSAAALPGAGRRASAPRGRRAPWSAPCGPPPPPPLRSNRRPCCVGGDADVLDRCGCVGWGVEDGHSIGLGCGRGRRAPGSRSSAVTRRRSPHRKGKGLRLLAVNRAPKALGHRGATHHVIIGVSHPIPCRLTARARLTHAKPHPAAGRVDPRVAAATFGGGPAATDRGLAVDLPLINLGRGGRYRRAGGTDRFVRTIGKGWVRWIGQGGVDARGWAGQSWASLQAHRASGHSSF